jgi:hypothetical protein
MKEDLSKFHGVSAKPKKRSWISKNFYQFVIVACLTLMGCERQKAPTVTFIIPDEFHGPFKVMEQKTNGAICLENGQYVYRIPTDGVVYVNRALGFREWHLAQAYFSNGKRIPVRFPDDRDVIVSNTVLYEIANTSNEFFFFIGSCEELLLYLKSQPFDTEAGRFWAGEMTNGAASTKGLKR